MDIKKMSAGSYVAIITIIAAVVGLVYAMINSGTDSFSKIGTSSMVTGGIVVAIIALVIYIVLGQKQSMIADAMPVIAGAALMIAAAQFIIPRVNTIASIMTFTSNAQTMADLQSCIVAEAALVVAAVINMVGAFLPVSKN